MNRSLDYLSLLKSWRDEPIIKAVTGESAAKLTSLLADYQQYIRSTGVDDNRIIAMNFASIKNLPDYRSLYFSIKDRLHSGETTYILLDSIHLIAGFEKVIASLYTKEYVDIYIAGPQTELFSGSDATLLAGRYVEINMVF